MSKDETCVLLPFLREGICIELHTMMTAFLKLCINFGNWNLLESKYLLFFNYIAFIITSFLVNFCLILSGIDQLTMAQYFRCIIVQ